MQNQLHNYHSVNVNCAVVSAGRDATHCLWAEQGRIQGLQSSVFSPLPFFISSCGLE